MQVSISCLRDFYPFYPVHGRSSHRTRFRVEMLQLKVRRKSPAGGLASIHVRKIALVSLLSQRSLA